MRPPASLYALAPSDGSPGGGGVCWWQTGPGDRRWRPVRTTCRLASRLRHPVPWLESPRVGAVLCACTVLVVAVWIWRAFQRRHPGLRHRPLHDKAGGWRRGAAHGLAGASVVVLGFLTVLAFVNAYAGYAPSLSALAPLLFGGRSDTAAAASTQASTIQMVEVGAPRLRVPSRPAYIYLPPGYDSPSNAHRFYPVVYLIHGYPGSAADWLEAGDLRHALDVLIGAGRIPPVIAVTPDANGGWLHDSECLNQVGGPQVATYLTRTVVDYIDAHYRALPGRADRVLGGASSGGYCALNLGLHDQGEYKVLLAFEPFGTPGAANQRALLGGSERLYEDNSPAAYLPRMRFTHRMAVFIDAGGADAANVRTARSLAAQLAARGQIVAFRTEPGQSHTWREAAFGLPYALAFTAGQFPGTP